MIKKSSIYYLGVLILPMAPLAVSAYVNPVDGVPDQTVTNAWDITSEPEMNLYVGSNAVFKTLTIVNGGSVTNGVGFIGYSDTSTNNRIMVSGGDWVSEGRVEVGRRGYDNQVVVSNAGSVVSTDLHIGYDYPASGNSVVIDGPGSVWTVSNQVNVGRAGTGNSLTVSNGGILNSGDAAVGLSRPESTGNHAMVTGSNSTWNVGTLTVGGVGGGNMLTIDQGGVVTGTAGILGDRVASSGNQATVSGAGSQWNVSGILKVGSDGSNNQLVLQDGGTSANAALYVGENRGSDGNQVMVQGNGSHIESSSSLIVGRYGVGNRLEITDQATANNQAFVVGRYESATGNSALISDSGDLSTLTAYIGYDGAGNSLVISSNGTMSATRLYMGYSDSSTNNSIEITGAGSELAVGTGLYLGGRLTGTSWSDRGAGQMLALTDGAMISGNSLIQNRNSSSISIDSTSSISGNEYYQSADSILTFGVSTNASGVPQIGMVSVDTATFESNATIQVTSEVGSFRIDSISTNMLIDTAVSLIVAGETNVTTAQLNEALNLESSLLLAEYFVENNDIKAAISRQALADSAGFEQGTDMADVANEIDYAASSGNPVANTQLDILNSMSGAQQNSQLRQLYERALPSYQHRQSVLSGVDVVGGRADTFQTVRRKASEQPAGVAGPHDIDQGPKLWLKAYGSRGSRDQSGQFDGYDDSVYGTILGYDQAFNEWLVGAALGYGASTIESDANDQSDGTTGYGVLYAAWGTVDWFADISLAYGRSSVDTESGTAFDTKGSFDADTLSFYISGGKEIPLGKTSKISPELGLQTSRYSQDAYTETSSTGLPRAIDQYDRTSVQSILGATYTAPFDKGNYTLEPRARLFWIHEFNADDDALSYNLIGGGSGHTLFIQGPDSDLIKLGVGVVSALGENWELALDLDGYFGSEYRSAALSGKVSYEF